MNRYWRLAVIAYLLFPALLFGQLSKWSQANPVSIDYNSHGLITSANQDDLVNYCSRELFTKLQERPYQINRLPGQGQSFEIWIDSISRRFLILIDIPEEGWITEHLPSIPLIFNRYQKTYIIDAYVKIFRKCNEKPLLVKKYHTKVSGRKAYQICQNNPNDNILVVPFRERFLKEKQAYINLAANLADDIFAIAKQTMGDHTGKNNVPKS